MTTRITIRHGLGSGSVKTTDAAFTDDVERTLAGIKNCYGVLDPADVAKIRSILSRYGSPNVTTTAAGVSMGDSLRADRDRQAAHTKSINARARTFWDAATAAELASVRR